MKEYFLLMVAAILLIGCGNEEDDEDYHPLAVGLQWEYAVTQIDTLTITGVQISTITAEVSSPHGVLFEQVTSTEWDDTATTAWLDTSYIQETDGNVLFYSDLNDSEPDTLFVLPLVLGNLWTVRTEPWGDMTGEAVGIEDVIVHAHTFNDCWHVEYTGLNATGHSWLAPGIGLIKHHFVGSTSEFLKELTDFTRR
ncbi:MAG: hypothetical protein JSV98_04990 [candidate division WOR-3 bacterium]|nr:MAG: hypothetical protein JSV98_04990 [candidate division WOR-3 bacterium]